MQLQSDSHEQLHVQRIVVCDKGTCCGSTSDRVQGWAFDLTEFTLVQSFSNRFDNFGTFEEAVARAFVVGKIDVALSLSQLGVGQTNMLSGWRSQRFAEDVDLRREDGGVRQFASFARHHRHQSDLRGLNTG